MGQTDLTHVADILRNLPGVVGLARLDDGQRRTAVELEAQYAGSSALQVRNRPGRQEQYPLPRPGLGGLPDQAVPCPSNDG